MALKVKDVGRATRNWQQGASGATGRYTEGVQGAGQDWEQNSLAAEQNYVTAVTQAASTGLRAKGIQKAGASRWQKGASEKGSQRFGPGVAAAQTDYQAGVAPYLANMANLTLTSRQPTGSPANIERVREVAQSNRELKMRGGR